MNLCLPVKILDQHLVVLGKTGAGKSSALRHVVEHLLDHKKRVCIIDPKGDWWGIKSSADGRSAGYPVIAFGDFKNEKASDVPINQHSGKHVAELITKGNRPCIIGFRGWMTSHMVQFWIDFASAIFNANSGELYLVGDEFHNFAPKGKIMDPQAGKCLHWSNRLLSEGRGLGIVCLIASQRPQKVHNDTLTSCETLVAMRVIHAADRSAVEEWIKGCGDKDRGKEVLNSLASMARGEAFVWSPEIDFGPKRLTFPMFQTFDSFAPPQLQKKISERGWADVDLNEVKEKLASVIEEAKANDPRELRKEMAKMTAEHKHLLDRYTAAAEALGMKSDDDFDSLPELARAAAEQTKIETREVSILRDEHVTGIHKVLFLLGDALGEFHKMSNSILDAISSAGRNFQQDIDSVKEKRKIGAPVKKEVLTKAAFSSSNINRNGGDVSLGRCERAVLTALAQYPNGRSPTQIAILTGYSGNSGGFNNSLSKLRSSGLITRSQPVQITQDGLAALGDWEPLPIGQALLRYWESKLGRCERVILQQLASSYPNGLTASEIAEATGYSPNSGGFNNSLSRLRTLELINRGQPIKISEELT